jgi:Chalcone isomerase-like
MRELAFSLLLSLFTSAALAVDVEGIPIAARTSVENNNLSLNGAGLRTKYFFKIYVAALYVQEPTINPDRVIKEPGAKSMQLILLRDLSAEQLIEALQQGLEQNLSANSLASLQPRLTAFENVIRSLHEGRQSDKLILDFVPGIGTQIRMNGISGGAPISGEDFYRALLTVWLGNTPVQDSLKHELLLNNH